MYIFEPEQRDKPSLPINLILYIMKLKFGAIVTDGRGKIGGHVASKNRGGAYLRTKVTPSNPNTEAQSAVRSILSSLSAGWSQLTDIQRASWNGAVSDYQSTDIFGDIKKPSGFNLYMKLNATLLSIGAAVLSEAPAKEELGDAYLTAAAIDITGATITVTLAGAKPAGASFRYYATPSMSAGISNAKNRFRIIANSTAALSGAALYTAYIAKFGVPQETAAVQIGIDVVALNGQKSVVSTVKASIEA
jgi:hypothetical protein